MRRIIALAAAAALLTSVAQARPMGGHGHGGGGYHGGGYHGGGYHGGGYHGGGYHGGGYRYYGGYRGYGGYPYSYGYNWAPAIVGGVLALGAVAAYSCWRLAPFPDGTVRRVWVCE